MGSIMEKEEELEELEDSEDFLDDIQAQPEEMYNDRLADELGRNSKYFTEANIFDNSIFPVFFVNKELKIIFANSSCKKLLPVANKFAGQYFTDIFGKYINLEDIKQIREIVLTGNNGYSWKGEVKIKTRETVTTQAKLYLFPLDIAKREPEEFIFMFDDVTEENRRLLRSVFLSLLEASKLKDNDTGRHITRVNKYSLRLSQELFNKKGYDRIDADFIDNIGFLASMHDVGKIGTPDDILNKEGPLSDWEWTVMQEHTKNGAFILSTYPNPMAKEIALSHHERWNGTGYPFNLEGDMIPLAARIVAIADVYDALRMKRSYKPAYDHKKTMEKMMESRSVQFDPSLLDVFYHISGDFNDLFDANRDAE
ncbi:MAG: HD domain-containing protein [Spirochaetaceae bacterium]|jgi:putative two-component system response regulator|nr:HD domain-containing protein [Spirochaetaceae bacterium]